MAIYAGVKPYPIAKDAAGNVLVDGAKMANDTFKGVGWCAAFLTGWILERRFVQFPTNIFLERKTVYLELTPQSRKPWYGQEIVFDSEQSFVDE